jgi:serine/threonine-protein kinase haspin
MLSGRTKQVVSYGRRGRRIINAPDDQRRTENYDTQLHDVDPYSAPSPVPGKKHTAEPKVQVYSPLDLDASPFNPRPPTRLYKPAKRTTMKAKKSPKLTKIGKAEVPVPVRYPLALFSPNVPGSPAVASIVVKKRKPTQTKKSPLKPQPTSPTVDLDIVVLDNQGRRVSQERRVSRTDVQVNCVDAGVTGTRKARKHTAQERYSDVSSDVNESLAPKPAKMKRGTKARPIVVSDDSSTDEEDDGPLAKIPKPDFTAESPPRIRSESPLFPSPPILHMRSRAAAAPNPVPSRPSFPPQAPEFVLWKPASEPIYDPTAFAQVRVAGACKCAVAR